MELAAGMARLSRARGVPFIPTTDSLAADPGWTAEAPDGDGAHSGSAGYQRPAGIVLAGPWHDWMRSSGRLGSSSG